MAIRTNEIALGCLKSQSIDTYCQSACAKPAFLLTRIAVIEVVHVWRKTTATVYADAAGFRHERVFHAAASLRDTLPGGLHGAAIVSVGKRHLVPS